MKKILLLATCSLFLSSCMYEHFTVSELNKKYERKMRGNGTEKFEEIATGKNLEVKKKDLFEKTSIFFSENEISRPFKVISNSSWNPANYRVLFSPLLLFTKSHIKNQTLRKAALANAATAGDGIIVGYGRPVFYKIIKFTDGKDAIKLPTSEILDKDDIKKAQKELEKKAKEESKKNKQKSDSKLPKFLNRIIK